MHNFFLSITVLININLKVSFVGITMAQSTASGTSSRRHIKDHDISTNTRLPHYGDSEWETREVNILFYFFNYLLIFSYTDSKNF